MLSVKKISEVLGKQVFTDTGDFVGQIEEVNLSENKIDGWRIKLIGKVSRLVGGARGIIVPHQFVKAIGDVFVVSKASLPIREETEFVEETLAAEA